MNGKVNVKRLLPMLLLVFSVGVGANGIHECDALTVNPLDAQRVTDGISGKEFKRRGTEYTERAIRACTQAIDEFPVEARFDRLALCVPRVTCVRDSLP